MEAICFQMLVSILVLPSKALQRNKKKRQDITLRIAAHKNGASVVNYIGAGTTSMVLLHRMEARVLYSRVRCKYMESTQLSIRTYLGSSVQYKYSPCCDTFHV